MRVAFYAPLKPPDHPVPSGDRQMARLLMAALRHAGHSVEVVSDLRSFVAAPDPARQAGIEREAERARQTIAERWRQKAERPDVWFTYHNHCKAPDLLGPKLAPLFGLPFVMAEASHAPSRAPLWGDWHVAAETATRAADLHLCFTGRDREGIADLVVPGGRMLDLPPFIDVGAWPASVPRPASAQPTRIVTVAMMRHGDKLRSYRFLAEALGKMLEREWHLTVIGDGDAWPEVEVAFAKLPPARLHWRGALAPSDVAQVLAEADLFAWPGFGEAFGLAYLEAQAMGLPVVALDIAGVSSVMRPGATGLLVEERTPAGYAAALCDLCANGARRRSTGRAASAWVRDERTLEQAAVVLDNAMARLVAARLTHA